MCKRLKCCKLYADCLCEHSNYARCGEADNPLQRPWISLFNYQRADNSSRCHFLWCNKQRRTVIALPSRQAWNRCIVISLVLSPSVKYGMGRASYVNPATIWITCMWSISNVLAKTWIRWLLHFPDFCRIFEILILLHILRMMIHDEFTHLGLYLSSTQLKWEIQEIIFFAEAIIVG